MLPSLFAGESMEPYAEDLGFIFEFIALRLMDAPSPDSFFDGAAEFRCKIRNPRKIEFTGIMHVTSTKTCDRPPLLAVVTDMHANGRDFRLDLQIGENRAQVDLDDARLA
ncbi:hypothetical protein [Luteolibacter sp. LG18]|uniref:hypothetical protein n=1 Tax=Luteolibacter sp. LG18 TaxID=2819286 RepID=UPI0030C67E21